MMLGKENENGFEKYAARLNEEKIKIVKGK
jgi:hypothetical protein